MKDPKFRRGDLVTWCDWDTFGRRKESYSSEERFLVIGKKTFRSDWGEEMLEIFCPQRGRCIHVSAGTIIHVTDGGQRHG